MTSRPPGKIDPRLDPRAQYERPRTNTSSQLTILKASLELQIDSARLTGLQNLSSLQQQVYARNCEQLKSVNYQLGIRS